MKRHEVVSKVFEYGLVAVIRGNSFEEALNTSKACIDGGINCIEVTYTVPDADKVIKELVKNHKNTLIGAGTVLDECTARLAIMSGAQFVVSPTFSEDAAKICNLYQVSYMPGCMTVTEIKNALEMGADIVKLFPGSMYKPEFIKAVKAPLPQANIMPTGGVNLENMDKWFENGAVAVGTGGSLTAAAKNKDYAAVTMNARKYVDRVNEIRSK
ncbi:bifunctional 2-keto-4-hydroxyglutarate aldolase/2-keto-3-deoxy-6-phosphogluconate aldolase [Clostridium sp. JS66]|uniref:bifunctional 2-keto-4-hydroxyglutarate aldolase/2-keto-3-deoxy-6-phosphogluconate aldolase n=1 Tax=Clostridium sp. JS66 TaxID=3064705 RepID=UPI00298ECB62|nr:bifunctional 2-keto-4-hydroxyglutarate aldolase/2-keto-3-deoxy-6-phosphogluconate aldolase [Clostridium sp. JS66]WPC40404.1 bifunctional 2-keto-4-hydroxyglutarate aldolase/2-keto-3-deoxy-6-phosphogluconate aldolase [Clostridium sp. JS66]